MPKSLKKLSTIASALLLACSLALIGVTVAKAAEGTRDLADSWWGLTVPEGEPVVSEPIPAVTPGAEAAPADSVWG
ncbi:hypothetical protein [Streptomyces sp. NPDC058751]|uniref:hypothetical protein n=1 Tax=Streptomyces sp. NPDC058751 TaxID=3346623 RepID=UPI003688D79C